MHQNSALHPLAIILGFPDELSKGADLQLPLARPDITDLEIAYVNKVLNTPVLSMGPMVEQFESSLAEYIGCKYAIAVNSGTSGLHTCIIASGIEAGDRVITTPFSFIASSNCILYERAIPVFVDIDPNTLNIDTQKIDDKLRELERNGNHSKAILPVHIFGQPCDMDPIVDLASRHNLTVIEDACEAIGAEYQGQRVGTFGSAAVFSFYPNKQITVGEGGVIVTNDQQYAELCRSIRNQGRDTSNTWLNHIRLGYNYRLDELSAALGIAQLERIEDLLTTREVVASWYNERLASIDGIRLPNISPLTTRMSWFVYVIRLNPDQDRNRIMLDLDSRGIPTRPYFSPIHLQRFYQDDLGYRPGDFPVTEMIASSTLAIPFFSAMTEDQVEYVCDNLRQVIRG
jgi:dTDP-4-amino-4,6-dideoxygalactose transaminase